MTPQPHPQIHDPLESHRCPHCGTPGHIINTLPHGILELACPTCEPDAIGTGPR